MRGFAVGTLTLIALDVLATHTQATSGLLGTAQNLFESFLSPDVPALHHKGNWPHGTKAGASPATNAKPATGGPGVQSVVGPAHGTVLAATGTQSI